MKKIIVKDFYVSDSRMDLVANCLTRDINIQCPVGYHYKETILSDIKEKDCCNGYHGIVLVVFEED